MKAALPGRPTIGVSEEAQLVCRCLVIQHVEPEGPYAIGEALAAVGVAVELCRTFAGDQVPEHIDGFDALVVMGGPMSACGDEGFPSCRAEVGLIADALERQVPMLGVCLGSQLLARAAGGTVHRGAAGAEIGWAPAALTSLAGQDALFSGLVPELSVLHWHEDTFELPPGSTHLAASPHYPNQAFRVGERAWGLQFHLEVDEAAVEAFLHCFGREAAESGADPEEIRNATPEALPGSKARQSLGSPAATDRSGVPGQYHHQARVATTRRVGSRAGSGWRWAASLTRPSG